MAKQKYECTGIQRYPAAGPRERPLGVISFKKRAWSSHVVRIVNLSVLGVGIESDERIEPGLVWFKEGVSGYKCGALR